MTGECEIEQLSVNNIHMQLIPSSRLTYKSKVNVIGYCEGHARGLKISKGELQIAAKCLYLSC